MKGVARRIFWVLVVEENSFQEFSGMSLGGAGGADVGGHKHFFSTRLDGDGTVASRNLKYLFVGPIQSQGKGFFGLKSFKIAAKDIKIKAILGVGDLETMRNVAKASLVCMMAGADFIKTSTGKENINANLNNSLVMLRMIREFYEYSGKRIGFKPAGGISTAKSVIEFLILVMEELGEEWINPSLLRIGASSLLIDIERQLYHHAFGRYATKDKLAIA